MRYQYRAYTLDKRIVQGTIDGASESMAEEALYQAGYRHVLSIKEVRQGRGLEQLMPTFFGIKDQDVIDFSHQLATLIEAGITILAALELLERQTARAAFKKVIAELVEELRGGSSLSQALSKYPQAFSYTYRQIIRASEQTGSIEDGLNQVASYMEKRMTMKKKVTRAMAYPAFVLLMAIGVVTLLMTVVLPPLVGVFTSLGGELPMTTKMLITAADFLIAYKLYLLGGVFALVIVIALYLRLPAGKLTIDRLTLEAPLIGPINVQRNMCYFCQTTSMLLKAGLQLPQTMDIVIQTFRNRIIRQALRDIKEKLVQGQGLSQPMAAINLFPPLLVEMVSVGEKTGDMDSALTTLADFYEKRVDQRIDTLISMMEPILTVVAGLVVGFIAFTMISSLYSMLGSM